MQATEFETGVYDLINGRLSPMLIPVESLMKGLSKIKTMVY